MKFSGLLSLSLVAGAVSASPSLMKRADATDVIAQISDKVSTLDSAITSWTGGDYSKVKAASDSLISTINDGASTVSSGPDLSNADALALTGPVQDLTDQVETTIQHLISKKEQAVSEGAGGTVKTALNDQYDAAQKLADAITSKVPDALTDIANELSAGISAAIQKGIDAYKDVPEGGDGGSDGGDGGAPAPTSTGTGTEPEPTATATETATETEAPEPTETSSTPVIPTSEPTGSPTPAPPVFTGAAGKVGFSMAGNILAAAAVAVAL
ncbi:cell wall mannoprotein 1 family protein [Aspergillus lucknowensis]|uniref:Hydrophobic surface binding protein A-domain-containing protein n=1 Tax=Aspergillus lucknowensis TaxID=176173 RepID=A0ABR4M7M8_9EURO